MHMLLNDKLKGKNLLLASASPRRRALLAAVGLNFTVADKFSVNEVYPPELPAAKVAEYLSGLKSDGYPAALGPDDILLTADTVVICGGVVLGKPRDAEDARRMLAALSGRTHTVVSGVTLRSAQRRTSFSVCTDVRFRELSAEEIDCYVARCSPLDKAGAYGIQEWMGYVGIERIDGSFYNVMGLPTQAVYMALDKFLDL